MDMNYLLRTLPNIGSMDQGVGLGGGLAGGVVGVDQTGSADQPVHTQHMLLSTHSFPVSVEEWWGEVR